MFESLKKVSYLVSDIALARNWYSELLGFQPLLDTPFLVIFKIGDSTLSLSPVTEGNESLSERTVVFWQVADVDAAYTKMISLGAEPVTEVRNIIDSRLAKLKDPFGNVIGITGNTLSASESSVDSQPSESAMTVAFCRALSYGDERDEYKGPDNLATLFLTEDGKKPLADKNSRSWVLKNMMLPGFYEFFNARTLFFDRIFKDAEANGFKQVVIIGAGYDTRAVRFVEESKNLSIYELDAKPTQARKLNIYLNEKIDLPKNLFFIPILFGKESFEEVFAKTSYKSDMKTAFIWEGVTYWLDEHSVSLTLEFIRNNSASGSCISFDYMVEAPDMAKRFGTVGVKETMQKIYKGESIKFSINEGEIDEFVAKYGFKIFEHLSADEIEKEFYPVKSVEQQIKVPALFAFATAEVI